MKYIYFIILSFLITSCIFNSKDESIPISSDAVIVNSVYKQTVLDSLLDSYLHGFSIFEKKTCINCPSDVHNKLFKEKFYYSVYYFINDNRDCLEIWSFKIEPVIFKNWLIGYYQKPTQDSSLVFFHILSPIQDSTTVNSLLAGVTLTTDNSISSFEGGYYCQRSFGQAYYKDSLGRWIMFQEGINVSLARDKNTIMK